MSSLDIFSPNPSSLFALYNAKYGFVVLTLFIGDVLVLLDVVLFASLNILALLSK